MTCPRCKIEMKPGKAFVSGDFGCFGPSPKDTELRPVLKCPECGHSDDELEQSDNVDAKTK